MHYYYCAFEVNLSQIMTIFFTQTKYLSYCTETGQKHKYNLLEMIAAYR